VWASSLSGQHGVAGAHAADHADARARGRHPRALCRCALPALPACRAAKGARRPPVRRSVVQRLAARAARVQRGVCGGRRDGLPGRLPGALHGAALGVRVGAPGRRLCGRWFPTTVLPPRQRRVRTPAGGRKRARRGLARARRAARPRSGPSWTPWLTRCAAAECRRLVETLVRNPASAVLRRS